MLRKIINQEHFIPWLLFIFITTCYFASTVGIMNSGDGPEYALTQAIVEEHTTEIDDFIRWSWPDYALVNGHMYTKRPPGLSFLAIPFYVIAKTLIPISNYPYTNQDIGLNEESQVETLTMVLPTILSAITIVIIYDICLFFTESKKLGIISGIMFALGTLMWKYSYSFLRQPLYVFLLVLIFYLLLKLSKNTNKLFSLILGFLVGYTFLTESTAIAVIPVLIIAFILIVNKVPQKGSCKLNSITFFFIGIVISTSIYVLYDLISVGQIYHNLYQDSDRSSWMNFGALFSTPLFPSLFLNLFSNGLLPIEAISPVLRNNPVLFIQESASFAIEYTYKGIFFQSPYLFLALAGFCIFIKKNRFWALLCLSVAMAILIPLSMYVDFYSPNAYDTRFFLPMIPFLTIGFAFFMKRIDKLNFTAPKLLLFLAILLLSIVSIYNGWLSNLTNYAPHITGEHRFSLQQLRKPFFASDNITDNLWMLFINTFPNIYNIHLLFLVYIPLCFIIYLFVFQRKLIIRKLHSVVILPTTN